MLQIDYISRPKPGEFHASAQYHAAIMKLWNRHLLMAVKFAYYNTGFEWSGWTKNWSLKMKIHQKKSIKKNVHKDVFSTKNYFLVRKFNCNDLPKRRSQQIHKTKLKIFNCIQTFFVRKSAARVMRLPGMPISMKRMQQLAAK